VTSLTWDKGVLLSVVIYVGLLLLVADPGIDGGVVSTRPRGNVAWEGL